MVGIRGTTKPNEPRLPGFLFSASSNNLLRIPSNAKVSGVQHGANARDRMAKPFPSKRGVLNVRVSAANGLTALLDGRRSTETPKAKTAPSASLPVSSSSLLASLRTDKADTTPVGLVRYEARRNCLRTRRLHCHTLPRCHWLAASLHGPSAEDGRRTKNTAFSYSQ